MRGTRRKWRRAREEEEGLLPRGAPVVASNPGVSGGEDASVPVPRSAEDALRVPMSKTDCAMQPGLGFRAGTGWPDSVYRVGDQTPATPREDWTSTAGVALGNVPAAP